MRKLNLKNLENGFPAISESVGMYLAEAGSFCFVREGHNAGVILETEGDSEESFIVDWNNKITNQIKRTWNDTEEATEYGAEAIAILFVKEVLGLIPVVRSQKGSGIDYWIGILDDNEIPIIKAGLEISGIKKANSSNTIRARVRKKKNQTKALAESDILVYIVVVEFSLPKLNFKKLK